MITSIRIENTASFTGVPVDIGPLKKLNYFFGGNGSGKTTLSRVVEKSSDHPMCQISWDGGAPLRTLVYNRDFVDANFAESGDLAGIFTLGEGSVGAVAKIKKAREAIDKIDAKLRSSREQLEGVDGSGGKRQELRTRYDRFVNECWSETGSHRITFKEAFKGFLRKKLLATRMVEENKRVNTSPPKTLADLKELAAEIFGEPPVKAQRLQLLHAGALTTLCKDPILSVAIVAKENVDLGALVKKLGSSDWMTKGLTYVDEADGVCPFCQQTLSHTLVQQLGDLFDESFNEQRAALNSLSQRYSAAETTLRAAGEVLLNNEHRFLNSETLAAAWAELQQVFERNTARLAQKCSEPSRLVSLDDIASSIAKINLLVDDANKKVEEQNRLVENFATERTKLIDAVWRYCAGELKSEFAEYRTDAQSISKAIGGLNNTISGQKQEKKIKEDEIRVLERGITSTKPTVERINQLLSSYDFCNFHLIPTADEKAYQIVRPEFQ